MTELFINGNRVDLNDETIVLSFGVNNLFSIESTQGVYSNTFKIPATNNNNLVFGISNNVLSASQLPYQSLPCEIYVNGLLQLIGIAQIQSASRFEYEILVVAGNGNWIDKLKDISLQSVLSSCEFTQYWNEATVTGSRSNIWSDIFIYPNIDYGNLFFLAGSDVDWNELLPAVYCKFLFKKIFGDIGYNISSDWFTNNALFQKQVIPFSAKFRRDKNYSLRNVGSWDTPAQNILIPGPPNNLYNVWLTNTLATSCYNALEVPQRQLKILDSVNITFRFRMQIDWVSGGNSSFNMLAEYTDLAGNNVFTTLFNALDYPVGVGQTIFIDEERTLTMSRSQLKFRYSPFSVFASDINMSAFQLDILEYDVIETDEGMLDVNQTFNWFTLGGTLPDMAATDFILTIANQYGLIFQENSNTNVLEIFQFKDIINNLPTPNDWSNKLDLSDEPVISFDVSQYAQRNYFQYAPDTVDEYLTRQPDLGKGTLEINQKNLVIEQVLFESIFSAMVRLLSYSGTIELAYIPVYEGVGTNDVNARMAYIEFDDSALLTIQPSGFFTNPQPNVYFADLDFKNLLLVYYPLYELILNNIKTVKCLLRLNTVDINNINFSKPIWIDYFGAYFYLNLIDQYNITTQDSTPVELILISN